jgi:hypothetical protein
MYRAASLHNWALIRQDHKALLIVSMMTTWLDRDIRVGRCWGSVVIRPLFQLLLELLNRQREQKTSNPKFRTKGCERFEFALQSRNSPRMSVGDGTRIGRDLQAI